MVMAYNINNRRTMQATVYYSWRNGIMVKKKKTMTEMMLQIRNTWKINPRTRIKEDEQKNKKKRREADKKLVKTDDSTPE
jgi:hypothetical protein